MTTPIITYAATLALFTAIDLVWLLGPGRSFYTSELGSLLRSQPNLTAAIAFYLLYAGGLTFFATLPGIKSAMPLHALGLGALLGLVAYGCYDLTNLSVINGFSLRIALIDMAWGTVLSGVVSWLVCQWVLHLGLQA